MSCSSSLCFSKLYCKQKLCVYWHLAIVCIRWQGMRSWPESPSWGNLQVSLVGKIGHSFLLYRSAKYRACSEYSTQSNVHVLQKMNDVILLTSPVLVCLARFQNQRVLHSQCSFAHKKIAAGTLFPVYQRFLKWVSLIASLIVRRAHTCHI